MQPTVEIVTRNVVREHDRPPGNSLDCGVCVTLQWCVFALNDVEF